ncbi:MAG: DUF2341 domain-containing protein [Bacteroidetes bacterium]|nr:DUF2341 domain-containing protein [Bacteroidota bacterium]
MTQTQPCYAWYRIAMRTCLPVLLLVSHLYSSAQPSGYNYGKVITINHSLVAANQTNFPVLINVTDPNLRTTGNGGHMRSASANDVVFTADDGVTLLPYQMERYSATTGDYTAWVLLPSISATTDVRIGMFYGKGGVGSNPSVNTIWDANYLGIWHFNSSISDATTKANNLTNSATGTGTFNNSKIGDGRVLANGATFVASNSGSCRYLQLPNNIFSGVTNFTFEGWVYLDDNATSWERIFDFGQNTNINMFLTPSMTTNGVKRFAITTSGNGGEQQVSSATTSAAGAWHHYAVTIDASTNTATLYYDGVANASSSSVTLRPSSLGSTTANYFGRSQYSADDGLYGKFDEFRISNIARSASWIQTSYNNQNTPGTFTTFSTEMSSAALLTALPVTLHSFTGMATADGSVQLQWETEKETNNQYFILERSAGNDQWSQLTTVPAGKGLYIEYDKNPFTPLSSYRLKQVDIDGTISSLGTVAVHIAATRADGLSLYPNPASGHVFAGIKADLSATTVRIKLTDWLGRVHSVPFSTAANGVQLQTSNLPAGNYALTVYANGKEYVQKLMIVK